MSDNSFESAPYEYVKEVLLSRSDTSYWLKDALRTLDNRDPLDAINDVTILKTLMIKRADEIQKRMNNRYGQCR